MHRKFILSLIALLFLPASQAVAEKRVALLIGNSAYQYVAPLNNPVNDASAMAATFRKANFDIVDTRSDLTVSAMRRALRDFIEKARDSDVAVIYYAGHGIEIDGTNYLIPVDAQLERDTDVFDEAFSLDRILVAVEPAKQLRLIILDACRDNPFSKTMKRTIGSRSIGRGLAKVEPSSPNTMIAFAAKAGSTASDGDSKNSPFATALVNHIAKPGLDLRKAFGFVRDDVLKATANKQEPFVYGSLGGNVALVPAVEQTQGPAAASSASSEPRRDYELAASIGTVEVWDSFIANYPTGFYTDVAKAQRNKVAAEAARLAATEKAKLAAEEQARLAAENARAAEQARAAAATKASEEARIASEKKKAAEDAKAAEAERAKTAALAKAAEKAADAARVAAEKKAADEAKKLADKAKDENPIGPIAALTLPADSVQPFDAKPATVDIPRLLQSELRRVGCNTGAVDGNWNAAAQKTLDLFNKNAGMKLDVNVASLDALNAVKSQPARICPLICDHGYKADGDRCSKITCRAGYEVGDDNSCERIAEKKPRVKRDAPATSKAEQSAERATSKTTEGSGQILCDGLGCREVRKGCRIVLRGGSSGPSTQQMEVCD
jgi:uncharacterized caspase-like protein